MRWKRWNPLAFGRLGLEGDEAQSPLHSPRAPLLVHAGSHRTVYINEPRAHQHYKVLAQVDRTVERPHSPPCGLLLARQMHSMCADETGGLVQLGGPASSFPADFKQSYAPNLDIEVKDAV